MARHYAVNLVVEGRRCLVVGGGPVAARKAQGLRDAGAAVTVVAERVGEEVAALDGVEVAERAYRTGDLDGRRLVISATDDPGLNARVYAEADGAGLWVCSADDPDHCSFTLPSILRRGTLQVAVSTGGRSPAVAAWLRRRLEAEIGPEYGVLVDVLADERATWRAAGHSTEGLDWRRALESDMLVLIREGHVDRAREQLHECLSSSSG